jgi:hypothetical protein
MEYIAIILFCLLIAGGVLGLLWRWRLLYLVVASVGLAVILFVALRGWSDLDFAAVIRNGSAIISWVVHLAFEFLWAVVPVLLGAFAGWLIRRRYCAHENAAS